MRSVKALQLASVVQIHYHPPLDPKALRGVQHKRQLARGIWTIQTRTRIAPREKAIYPENGRKGNANQNAEDLPGIKGIIPKRAGKTVSLVKLR